ARSRRAEGGRVEALGAARARGRRAWGDDRAHRRRARERGAELALPEQRGPDERVVVRGAGGFGAGRRGFTAVWRRRDLRRCRRARGARARQAACGALGAHGRPRGAAFAGLRSRKRPRCRYHGGPRTSPPRRTGLSRSLFDKIVPMSDDSHPSSDTGVSGWWQRLVQGRAGDVKTRDDIAEFLETFHERGIVGDDEFAMLQGVLEVADTQVRDIMVPRSQMVVVAKDQTPEEVLKVITESNHSRFPVIGGDKDEVVGIVLAKDMLKHF